jgi:predicted protein tyrosine phosphatase
MSIKILRKSKFHTYLNDMGVNMNNVESFKDYAFISILNSGDNSGYFKENRENVLILFFDDIITDLRMEEDDEDYVYPVLFNDEHVKDILEFINKNGNKNYIIHCSAGISRSGAVGTYINNYFNLDKTEFYKTNPQIQPNPYVLNKLNMNINL